MDIKHKQHSVNTANSKSDCAIENAVAAVNKQQSAKKPVAKTNRNEVGANWNSLASTILPKKPKSPSKKMGMFFFTSTHLVLMYW